MNKTIYVKAGDRDLYARAEQYAADRDMSLSELISVSLRHLMSTVDLQRNTLQEKLDSAPR